MNTVYDKIDYLLIAGGTLYSIDNIKSILGLIVLAIQVVWLLTKLIIKLVQYIKAGKDVDELDGRVDDIVDIIKPKEEDNGIKPESTEDKQQR